MRSLLVACALFCGALPILASDWKNERNAMVRDQLEARAIKDRRVLDVMRKVPRHEFVPASIVRRAYEDNALPIGLGQTISQPYIVAYMTEELRALKTHKVLEIGTGSGYQAAVLAELAKQVFTIEIVPELAERSKKTLARLGYANVKVRAGDGYRGWPEAAPFDRIIVTAAPDHIPQPLIDQLAVGGRLVIPVGDLFQQIIVVTKTKGGVVQQKTIDVRFVPMTGEAQRKK